MTGDRLAFAALIAFGAGWGLGAPVTKFVVSEGHRGFGVVFWWQVIGLAAVAAVCGFRRKRLVLTPAAIRLYVVISLTGAVIPNYASVTAAEMLPSGILSLVISMTPLFAFPIALALGRDRAEPLRLVGLLLGLVAMALIALPQASLPDRLMLAALPIALVTPLCYALEANMVGGYEDLGLDPVQALFGAFAVGTILTLPLALAGGTFIRPAPTPGQAVIVFGALTNAAVYVGYVWLVARAGAVFAAQVSYLVTGFGVVWAIVLLGERFATTVWAAFVVLLLGITLVRPRAKVRPAR